MLEKVSSALNTDSTTIPQFSIFETHPKTKQNPQKKSELNKARNQDFVKRGDGVGLELQVEMLLFKKCLN